MQHSKVAWHNFVPSHLSIKKITWESQNKKCRKWWMTKWWMTKWWMTKLFVCYTEHQMKIVHCDNTKYTNTYCQLHYSLYEPTPLHILWRKKQCTCHNSMQRPCEEYLHIASVLSLTDFSEERFLKIDQTTGTNTFLCKFATKLISSFGTIIHCPWFYS